MKVYKGKDVEILKSGLMFSVIKFVGAEDHTAFSVKTALLTEKVVKLTDVQKALLMDPAILTELKPFVVRIEVSSSPAAVDGVALAISENSSVTESDALDYIRVVTDKSHSAKFDVIVSDSTPEDLRERAKAFFNAKGHRAHAGELQIGSKPLALWLMGEGVIPQAAR